ncbi:MAG: succinyldiaminopimelate transaminase [Bifidobacteriaceae bacterium]|jgi:succinyldiaminopimelate transaminase|nr:succinyldiaminopimelate transaminase [Bifidobacteriaceae bacterium]
MGFQCADLPVFPWDLLEPFKQQARAHPQGLIDLSVGTPVDPTPEPIQQALAQAANAPGYPATIGSTALREAIAAHYARDRAVPDLPLTGILPTIGSKEMVAQLPSLLGLGAGDIVAHPTVAYPTYDIGARLAGATPLPADTPDQIPDAAAPDVRLVWLNSPGNPSGQVASVEQMTTWVEWARGRGAVVASDECYAALAWDEPWASNGVPSLLDPRVAGSSLEGKLALYSLSKQSNAAGYRAAWLAGDPALVKILIGLRKHMGMMMPAPVQAAMVVALADRDQVAKQRETYLRRRRVLADGIVQAGYLIEGSGAGLYLWFTTEDRQDCWRTVADLASLGILVAPGAFYGAAGRAHVRMALTGSDRDVAEAAARLSGS